MWLRNRFLPEKKLYVFFLPFCQPETHITSGPGARACGRERPSANLTAAAFCFGFVASFFSLRQLVRQEERRERTFVRSCDQQQHVASGLQLRLHPTEFIHGSYRLVIDAQQDVVGLHP
jgi:hypothetical protein